jgi:predicted RND superfamily exporter protein
VDNVGYPILLDVFSNMGFAALIFSSLIPLIQMGGLMIFAMISTSFGTLTILAALMEINKYNLYKIEKR